MCLIRCSSRVSPIWRNHPASQNCQIFPPKPAGPGKHQLEQRHSQLSSSESLIAAAQHPEVTSEQSQVLAWGLMHHWKGKGVEGLCAGKAFPSNHQLLAWGCSVYHTSTKSPFKRSQINTGSSWPSHLIKKRKTYSISSSEDLNVV